MASSSEDNNKNNNDSEMGFEYRGEMRSGSMFNNKCSSFGSGWDPLENMGGSSSSAAAAAAGYHHHHHHHHQLEVIHQYESGSGIGDLVPKLGGSFGSGSGSGSFSEMNGERDLHDSSEKDEKKQRITTEHGNSRMGKQVAAAKDNSDPPLPPPNSSSKDNYIHVRAKRGQATNSHSLAERVRREKISERMKLLQELVPGCNKITGKAVMLDEIINYVQSLQQQVEFLSMKLATVNPELNIDIDRLVFKDILHSRGSSSNPGFGFSSSPHSHSHSYSYPHGNNGNGSLPAGIPTATAPIHPQHPVSVWDHDLHNLLQMGFDANPGINHLGPNGGRTKMDL